jgi:hypothetical protein
MSSFMIRDFSNDDIFIVIFTSSESNNHDEQICSLIGPSPQIPPLGWSRYLDKKKTRRWLSEDYYYISKNFEKLFNVIKFIKI